MKMKADSIGLCGPLQEKRRRGGGVDRWIDRVHVPSPAHLLLSRPAQTASRQKKEEEEEEEMSKNCVLHFRLKMDLCDFLLTLKHNSSRVLSSANNKCIDPIFGGVPFKATSLSPPVADQMRPSASYLSKCKEKLIVIFLSFLFCRPSASGRRHMWWNGWQR